MNSNAKKFEIKVLYDKDSNIEITSKVLAPGIIKTEVETKVHEFFGFGKITKNEVKVSGDLLDVITGYIKEKYPHVNVLQ